MHEYENFRRVAYDDDQGGFAQFVPVCIQCARFVKADGTITLDGEGRLVKKPNATCSKCGRIEMLFEGFFSEEEIKK